MDVHRKESGGSSKKDKQNEKKDQEKETNHKEKEANHKEKQLETEDNTPPVKEKEGSTMSQTIIIISKRIIKHARKQTSDSSKNTPRRSSLEDKKEPSIVIAPLNTSQELPIIGDINSLDSNPNNNNTANIPAKPFKIKFEDLPLEIQHKCTTIDKELLDQHMDILYNILTFLYKQAFNLVSDDNDGSQKYKNSVPEEKLSKARGLIEKTSTKHLKKHHFKKFQMSGKGAFGSVFLVKDRFMKKCIAVKKLANDTIRNQLQNETEVFFLSECKHPNIVEFYKCFEVKSKGQSQVWIAMEFLEGGTLAEAAALYNFSEKHIAYTARECLKGLKYLHDKGFAHRDLKSSNVMMSVKGDVKLIDFGLCADFSEGPRRRMMGSPYWVPPEMINNLTHTFSADIWSFAVCILELFLSSPPYPESPVKCMLMAATRGLKDQIPETATPVATDFLSSCLTIEQEKRATAEQLLQHEWVIQPNLEEGIDEILYQIFLSNSLSVLGL